MFMYMNYPVSVWFSVDSSPDKVVHGYTQQTSSALASEKGYVKWDLGGRKSKIIIISDNADMCLGGICMFLVDFLFFSHRKSIDTSSIYNFFFLINPSVLWICTWYRYKIEFSRLNDQGWNFLLGLLRILQSDLCRRKFTLTWMCEFKVQQKCCVW